jgi:hypothetical protein
MPLQRNHTAKAQIDALKRENAALKQYAHKNRGASFGSPEALDELDAELGPGATTPITMEGLRDGQFSPEQLADRIDELQAVMSGRPVAGGPVSRADVLAMTAEEVADFGAERALDILNGKGNR